MQEGAVREIKFRLWDSLKKEMLFEGFHVFGEVTLFDAIGCYAYETSGERSSLERYNDFEIMQYTGLKDKNGKEIYEGDICKDDDGQVYPVLCKPGYFSFAGGVMGCGDLEQSQMLIEVIGNIYENPELI